MTSRSPVHIRPAMTTATVLLLAALPVPAGAVCLDPSCCFGTNLHAVVAIVGAAMLTAAFPLLGAAQTALQSLLGAALQGGTPAAQNNGLPGISPAAGGATGTRTVVHPDRTYSVTDWHGYPAGVPLPGGPFPLPGPATTGATSGAPGMFDASNYGVDPAKLTPQQNATLATFWGGIARDLPDR